MANLWVRKSIPALQAEAAESNEHSLKRTLSATNLVMLGIGAIIGAGFFVLTGHAAAENAGPAVTLSFVVGRNRLRLRRALLRRDGLDGPDRRLGLYLRLCHDGRVHRLADRLGPDPRIHGRRHHGRDRLVGLRHQRPARLRHRHSGAVHVLAGHDDDRGPQRDRRPAPHAARLDGAQRRVNELFDEEPDRLHEPSPRSRRSSTFPRCSSSRS